MIRLARRRLPWLGSAAVLLLLSGCGIPPNWGAPTMAPPGADAGFHRQDPHPDSDEAQRQDDSMPEPGPMTCSGSGSSSVGANAGRMTSSTSCHN